jgi:hypothetical protein
MSVSTILSSLETETSDYLGATWKRINYTYEPEKNSSREDKRFGIGVANGTQVTGTFKAITMDTEFFITLQERFVNRSNDSDMRGTIDNLHDNVLGLYTRLINTKIGQPSIVLVVQDLSFEEPEILEENTVRVTFRFIVKYRNATVA